ncbi:TPA: sodium:calcium antiporter, partial [Candidatus Woesearchaeota archaeon]|nr:sodium:calcium antiporter [Candidatus Woesearchaeota archaeon]
FLLGRFDGAIFLLIFIIFIIYVYRSMLSEKKTVTKQFRKDFTHENPLWKNVLLMVGGIIGVVIGGKLFITEATVLASLAGLPKAFIGLTIAAIGTSLPELATSAVAAYKGKGDLAIGNIVGSNIFNILFVLGLTSMIKPIAINASVLSIDGMIMLFVTLLFLLFATTTKKLYRWEGGVLVVLYLSYLIWLIHGLF